LKKNVRMVPSEGAVGVRAVCARGETRPADAASRRINATDASLLMVASVKSVDSEKRDATPRRDTDTGTGRRERGERTN
jgi:hypothetical protein